jgi:hypothetical protein
MSTHGRAAYELAAVGFEALPADVLTLLLAMFESDKKSGELMMKQCRPEAISEPEFVIFKMCHKLAKMGKEPEHLFAHLDEENASMLNRESFGRKAKAFIEIPISEDDMTAVFDFIDGNKDGEISREEFMDIFNLEKF